MNTAINEAKELMKNPTVMNFVRNEALEKVAAEMREEGYSCTAKAVGLLALRYPNIAERVQKYVAAGIVGCLMAKVAA